MNTSVEFVEHQETLLAMVGKAILAKGFCLASADGVAMTIEQLKGLSYLGILYKCPEVKSAGCRLLDFITGKPEPLRSFLGTIWLNDAVRGARDENWVFEIYGYTHAGQLRQFAEELAATFKVKITLCVVSENPREELKMVGLM